MAIITSKDKHFEGVEFETEFDIAGVIFKLNPMGRPDIQVKIIGLDKVNYHYLAERIDNQTEMVITRHVLQECERVS
jgi:hypothetical protein